MSSKKECAAYFKQQKAWNRCFQMLRKKWEIYGKCSGRVVLEKCTEDERRAISGLMGKNYLDKRISFSLQDFEDALQSTRFAPITLEDLLTMYFGEALQTNKVRKQEKNQNREAFFQRLRGTFTEKQKETEKPENNPVLEWFLQMEQEQKYGYTILIRELSIDCDNAFFLAKSVGQLLCTVFRSFEEEIPLAVLAAKITGNPHYLDRGTTAGNLFIYGLCCRQEREFPKNASEWKEVLLDAGILPDDMASMVIAYGVHLVREDSSLHSGAESFWNYREPLVLTQVNLKNIKDAYTEGKRVYAVENEMVFSYLLDRWKNQNISLMCTSGQIRTAALELIRLLAAHGCEIYYSGDMDPEGMGIADRLWQRYPENVKIWRMSPMDYENGISEEILSEKRLTGLSKLQNPLLQETAIRVMEKKRAGYQENILGKYLEDIEYGIQE